MSKYEQLFHRLNDITQSSANVHHKAALKDLLKDLAKDLSLHPENCSKTAYKIAGLMATRYGHSLTPDNPIDEIVTIAGEL